MNKMLKNIEANQKLTLVWSNFGSKQIMVKVISSGKFLLINI